METTTIKISGMTCGGCVASVQRVVKGVPGVETVDVSLARGEAVVRYDSARTTPTTLTAAIVAAGFEVV
jgi:copper chaperone